MRRTATRGPGAEPDRPAAARLPVDLHEPPDVDWRRVEVPAGWEPTAAIARRVAGGLGPLVDRITGCICEEIPAYRDGTVPADDVRSSVERNLVALLVGLAEHRGPHPEEVAVRRELGVRRALQGLPVDALIQAYHVGYREVWLELVAATDGDPTAAGQLLTAATTVWRWVHEVTDALAAAHAATIRSLEARAVGARQRFVELLAAGELDGGEAHRLGRTLGFDVDADFVVGVVRGAPDDLDAVALQHVLDDLDGEQAVAARGPLVIVVSQGATVEQLLRSCRRRFPDAALAVGAERTGLHGARASLEDAEHTLEVTADGESDLFDDAWLWATLGERRERLRPVLAAGAGVAATHPHLAEAVTAFADGGFSVSAAARRLGLHPNTVAYRLDRWHALTGWDPRSFPGLARSLTVLRLGR